MFSHVLYDPQALALQVKRQKKYAWDLDKQIPWHLGVDTSRFLLPLDTDSIVFPGATPKQRLAISQLLGLIVNSTISEMEDVITKLRHTCWDEILRSYPVGPEMRELGELFFEEEQKHSLAFQKYNSIFCKDMGIHPSDLSLLLPRAYGSLFLKVITQNAKMGGHAFWWVVAAVEEVSIDIYKNLSPFKKDMDPLFHEVHLRHMEEESRHHNYAFLMLEMIKERRPSVGDIIFSKTDRSIGQIFTTGWIIAELNKVFDAHKLQKKHPFFETIASCLPLFKNLTTKELLQKLFISTPYISLVINGNLHLKTSKIAQAQKVLSLPFPKPEKTPTSIDESLPLKVAYGD